MTTEKVLRMRLANQLLVHQFSKPEEVISHLGAVQSQDFPGSKWALGQRLNNSTDQTIQETFDKGEILRTHVMRPTWHFVAPEDIRWMLALTKPQVMRLMASYNRKLELDEKVFKQTQEIIIKLLKEKTFVTRQELKTKLTEHNILTDVQRLAHIVMQAELDALICSGPVEGKQFTYSLLDARVPATKPLTQDEALAELAKRYFQSHGPAQVIDFAWWSGLPMNDVRKGIAMNNLQSEEIDGKTYYFFENSHTSRIPDTCYLLPNYDEYTIAYKDRTAFFNPDHFKHLDTRGNSVFQHVILYKGKVIGLWKRTLTKNSVQVTYTFFENPTEKEFIAFKKATARYEKFLGLPLTLQEK